MTWKLAGAWMLATLLAAGQGLPQSGVGKSHEAPVVISSYSDPVESAVEPADIPLSKRRSGSLEQAIKLWIDALAEQPEFGSWKNAAWSKSPLGPGTHSWVVKLQSRSGAEIGYLIVGMSPDGQYVLCEYGNGDHPLFSYQTLYQSMIRLHFIDASLSLEKFRSSWPDKLQQVYFSPFHAWWQITLEDRTTMYLDAKTGEALPIDQHDINKLAAGLQAAPLDGGLPKVTKSPEPFIESTVRLPSFDAYETLPFATHPPQLIQHWGDLEKLLNDKAHLTFAATPFEQKMLYPFPVTGYQLWSTGQAFISADQNGSRYLPFEQTSLWGKYYE